MELQQINHPSVLIDIITLMLVLKAQNDIAARQLLLHLASSHDEDYSRLVILKAIGLSNSSTAARQWLTSLY